MYRGAKAAIRRRTDEYNRIAAELERHINERIRSQEGETQTYLYYEIATETGYPLERVREILFGVDCGHNGFTVRKKESPGGAPSDD